MGRVKQLMMEMEEHDYTGFYKGEKCVCTHHFDDKYLNQYIQENSEDGICSYCHKKRTCHRYERISRPYRNENINIFQ